MAKALKLSRNQLAKFLPDNESIRQFEKLLGIGQDIDSGDFEEGILEAAKSFETVNKNLDAYPKAFTYVSEVLNIITYTVGASSITKTFNYVSDKLDTIVLSGNTPEGIDLTKTFVYSGDTLTNVSYS